MTGRKPFTLKEIKKIVYNTPGFFTCTSQECEQALINTDSLKTLLWGIKSESELYEVNGVKLAVQKVGDGESIVLLHGMRDSKAILEPLALELSKKFSVYSIDLRGHGYSEKPGGECSTALLADDVIKCIELMGLEKPILFGHSLGASVAMEIAAKKPGVLSKLIIAGAAVRDDDSGKYRPKNPEQMLKDPQMIDNFINMLNQRFFKHRKTDSRDPLMYIREKAMLSWMMIEPETAKSLLHLKRTNLEEIVSSISIPVLLMVGEKDVVGSPDEAAYIQKLMTACFPSFYRECGHYMFLEKLDQALLDIDNFITEKYENLNHMAANVPGDIQPISIDIKYDSVLSIAQDLNGIYKSINENTEAIEIMEKIGNVSIQFEFTDMNEIGAMCTHNGALHFEAGGVGKPDVKEVLDSVTFAGILLGEINAPSAAMAQKIKVTGDFYLLMRFQPLLGIIIDEYRKSKELGVLEDD